MSLAPRIAFIIACLAPVTGMMSVERAAAQNAPITIQHAFGETVLPQAPKRVATVAWANQEVPLALGIVPVGMARAGFGDDDGDGLMPWVAEKLDALGADTPVLFDEGDGIDFEAVAATEPDVILAAYSGLSREDYDMLSKIDPVIAYPRQPWTTTWREMIQLNSAGLGLAAEGDALIAQMEAEIKTAAEAHPELAGKSAMFVTHLDPTDLSTVNFYTDNDARVQFFHDIGMASPQAVLDASTEGKYSGKISAERIDLFDDVDIVVTYGGAKLLESLKASALTARMPAVARESIVMLPNNPLGSGASPTPLAISWVLEDYTALLAEAVRKAQ